MRRLIVGLVMGALSTAPLRAQSDSLSHEIASFVESLAPVDSARGAIAAALRPYAGTRRADSALMRLTPSFNALAYSILRNGQRREQLELLLDSPDARQRLADSVVQVLERHGVYAHSSEGETDYSPSAAALLASVGTLVTPPMRLYFQLLALEEHSPTGGDGAIDITWQDLGERVAAWDQLASNGPTFAAWLQARNECQRYLSLYLLGSDNTPAFARGTKVMVPALRSSLASYVAEHGSSASGALVAEYSILLREHKWHSNADATAFLRHAMQSGQGCG